MEREKALEIANQRKELLAPYCERIEIAGSLRRRQPLVHDIDLVLIPGSQGQLLSVLRAFGPFRVSGPKLIRVGSPEIETDVYIATPETWATLLLIRTGSKEHNIMLCKRARSYDMHLHADGSGLFKIATISRAADAGPEEVRVAGDSEESIFAALGLKYIEPEKREINIRW